LWREYKEQYPEGYQYSQFCDLYRRYRGKLDYSMRQDHRGGEKLFVDYGEGLNLVDAKTGEPITTQFFR
jgi:transposase